MKGSTRYISMCRVRKIRQQGLSTWALGRGVFHFNSPVIGVHHSNAVGSHPIPPGLVLLTVPERGPARGRSK
jgi:hypothetical protein